MRARPSGSTRASFFRFTNGARLYCAYLENEADAEHYQGWSLTRVYIEELTQFVRLPRCSGCWPRCARRTASARQMRCTCNPGGPGHLWVKEWAIDHGPYRVITDEDTRLTARLHPGAA